MRVVIKLLAHHAMTILAAVATATAAFVVLTRFVLIDPISEELRNRGAYEVRDWDSVRSALRVEPDVTPASQVIVLSDFACGYCSQAHETLAAFERDRPGEVVVHWRHYPFLSAWSREAAASIECVRLTDPALVRVAETVLFDHDERASPGGMYAGLARAGVVDTVGIKSCVQGPVAADIVHQEFSIARELGVDATPTLLVDGWVIPGVPDTVFLASFLSGLYD